MNVLLGGRGLKLPSRLGKEWIVGRAGIARLV